MQKTKLIAKVAEESGINKAQAKRAIESMVNTVIREVIVTGRSAIANLGIFLLRERGSKVIVNPRDPSTRYAVPPSRAVIFKQAKGLKKVVNDGRIIKGKAFNPNEGAAAEALQRDEVETGEGYGTETLDD
jgi:DNA-binding protein HU-beta